MLRSVLVFLCGGLIGGLVVWKAPAWGQAPAKEAAKEAPKDQAKAPTPQLDMAGLNEEVARLKTITPNLSHVMADVAFQYQNLWFAAQEKNWPLAMFYYNETRGRIRWMIRINPSPKKPDGEVVDLQGIFDGIDNSILPKLKETIEKKDAAGFPAAYKTMLESCYTCHKSAGRPYLRPMVPTTPPQGIINYDPAATWPG